MNKLLCLIILVIVPVSLLSQSPFAEVLASAGNYFESSNVSISWTLGEVAIETLTNDNMKLTQGFQQSKLVIISVQELDDHNLTISLYPNPANDILSIEVNGSIDNEIIIELFDATGRLLLNHKIEILPASTKLDLNSYSYGIYLLKVRAINHTVHKTFQIVKISK